jgi:hypothetical protein
MSASTTHARRYFCEDDVRRFATTAIGIVPLHSG